MLLVIDNYDSFVHNLARYLRELGHAVEVARNDAVSVDDVRRLAPRAVVLSPGPCDPERAGVSVPLVRGLSGEVPILGVCLGHQAIGAAFGARIARSQRPRHGVSSRVTHDFGALFRGVPNPFRGARYHSLVIDPGTLPDVLLPIAWTRDGGEDIVMAVRHRDHVTLGVQFHPESVLTEHGHRLLENFLALAGVPTVARPGQEPAASVVP